MSPQPTSQKPPGLRDPVNPTSRWRRRRLRSELQRGVAELAERAENPNVTAWRLQPVIEIVADDNYPAWRKARQRAWKRDRSSFNTDRWPTRVPTGELAGVFLPQTHGGQRRGQAAEVAMPVFAHQPRPGAGRDFEHPYEPLALSLAVGWVRLVLADPTGQPAVLLAPPLVDLITSQPRPRVAHDLSISWPLEVSDTHIRPTRLS